jgi:ATP-dependent DNA helicase RecQ
MPTIHELLHDQFGFPQFRPGQEEVIKHLLARRSAAAVFPTGSGKSLCYQLPALVFPGLTVVVSPLIALMKEQIDRLQARAIAAERLDSTLDSDATAAVMNRVRAGGLRLLYVAPERFHNERFCATLRRVRVSLFAVDEAHCISEWGHNFRPDYLRLAHFSKDCKAERTLALTATATPRVLADICTHFGIESECAVRTGFYRPNLTVLTTPMQASQRDVALVDRLQKRPAGPTIVYVTLQRSAEQVAERLAAAGLPARPYHAGLGTEQRSEVQDWFAGAERAVVVATIAFGMGIDKSNIRYVYHYNMPKSLENFAQEIGRAGRDGEPSTCEMFLCASDLNQLENFIYGDTPTLASIRGLVREIFNLGEEFAVGMYDLSERHDIRQGVLSTLLTYLELDGYLQAGTPVFSSYRFQPLVTSGEILKRFKGERRAFLKALFGQVKKGKKWFRLDSDKASAAIGASRQRIRQALEYLAEQKLLELEAEKPQQRFRRWQMPADLEKLAAGLLQRSLEREARELARINEVLTLGGHDGCQAGRLCAHFGETLPGPCGHCTWCLGGRRPVKLPRRAAVAIGHTVWQQAQELRRQQPDPFAEPRTLARFLCGLWSPRFRRDKLTEHDLYGVLSQVPFPEVLRRAEEP